MKLFFSSIILILFGLSIFYWVRLESPAPSPNKGCEYISGKILVIFKVGVSKEKAREITKQLNGEVFYEYDSINSENLFNISVPIGKEKEYVEKFQSNPFVESEK